MRKLLLIIMLAAVGAAGCKKENSDASPQNQLLGRWDLEYYVDTLGKTHTVPGCIIYLEFERDSVYVYNSCMEGQFEDYSFNVKRRYTISGDTMEIIFNAPAMDVAFLVRFKADRNSLHFTHDDEDPMTDFRCLNLAFVPADEVVYKKPD